MFVKAASAEILRKKRLITNVFSLRYIFIFIAAWREHYITIQDLPFPSLSFSSVAAAHRLNFCCTLRRISSSIWSQIVVGCESSRWCSCILNSTWTSATQHTIDSSNPDTPHKLPSHILLFVSEMRLSCFILLKGFHKKISVLGPFLERLVNLTGPKSYFEIEGSRKVGCVQTSNEVYFVSLTDNFSVQFSNLLKLSSGMKYKTA